MAHDERDRMFEKALARHLRSSVSPSVAANSSTSSLACPDPEILAAYHEQSLSSSELTIWKAHVVACTHCQFVLSQLAATDSIALEPVHVQDPLLVETFSRRKQPTFESRSVERERRSPSWRWVLLIPAGAMAAILVAWVAIRTPKPGTVSEQSPVEVAENRQAPPVPAPARPSPSLTSPAVPAPKADVLLPRERKQAEKDQPAGPAVGGAVGAVTQTRDSNTQAILIPPGSPPQAQHQPLGKTDTGPSISAQKQLQQQLQSRMDSVESNARAKLLDKKKPAASAAPRAIPEAAASPAPPPPAPSQDALAAENSLKLPPRVPKPDTGANAVAPSSSPSSSNSKTQTPDAAVPSSVSESVEVSAEPLRSRAGRAPARDMLRAAAVQNPHVFWAPDDKHAWRLGPAGSIEYSKDRGEKWTPQLSGVTADLLSASAPSAKICWVVGSSGTILLTTDSGAHWTKLNSPVSAAITVVSAADASHANIVYSDPQTTLPITYRTTDGGATWVPLPTN